MVHVGKLGRWSLLRNSSAISCAVGGSSCRKKLCAMYLSAYKVKLSYIAVGRWRVSLPRRFREDTVSFLPSAFALFPMFETFRKLTPMYTLVIRQVSVALTCGCSSHSFIRHSKLYAERGDKEQCHCSSSYTDALALIVDGLFGQDVLAPDRETAVMLRQKM